MQPSGAMQALTPPSAAAPPVVAQQGSPAPPQAVHIPGTLCAVLRPAQARPELQVPPKAPQQI